MTYGQWPGQDGQNEQQGWPGDGGGAVPPQWRRERQDGTRQLGRYEQRGYQTQRPQPRFAPAQPPYRPQPPRGKSWPARHKALTGLLALLALAVIIAAANAGRPPAPRGSGTTAGLTTTVSATATVRPSHHATRAAAAAQPTQPQQTPLAAPVTSHAPATSHAAAPSAHAPAPSVPASTTLASTAPPPASSAAPVGCHPLTDAGNCYEPGEYCRDSDHGVSGVAGDGEVITCEDNDGWRWEPA